MAASLEESRHEMGQPWHLLPSRLESATATGEPKRRASDNSSSTAQEARLSPISPRA